MRNTTSKLHVKIVKKNHKTELKIVGGIFRPLKDDVSGYPIRIRVQDSKTGKIVEYIKRGGYCD